MQFIDLYLRTNTYPAFSSDEGVLQRPEMSIRNNKRFGDFGSFREIADTKKMRYQNITMTHDMADGRKKFKEDGFWLGVESDANVEFTIPMEEAVMSAKPSPAKNSEGSWSLPKDVPLLPGMLFPYFDGMLTGDKNFINIITAKHFMRCFGISYKEKYLKFRASSAIFYTSKTGIILTHILAGVDLSISSQTKLHLLFDGETYLGFCLLGSKWALQRANSWHSPIVSHALQAELNTIRTHSSSLEEVIRKLSEMGIEGGEVEDGCDLAQLLGQISFAEGDEGVEEQRWFDERVGRLDFGKRPENFGSDSFAECLAEIADETEPLTNYVHFPRAKFYHLFRRRETIALARYGYLAPSFNVSKGAESFRISSAHGHAVDDSARQSVKKIVVAMKPLDIAVKDFQEFRGTKLAFQGSSERAAVYRLHSFGGAVKDRFLKRVGGIITKIEPGKSYVEKTKSAGKKKEVAEREDLMEPDDDVLDSLVFM
jgi:hypothetical protein